MAKKGAKGGGTIRKKTVTRNGKEYTYWEARITTGYDPGTGKQIQKSFTGQTQREVREKMQAAAVAVNNGTYVEPSKMTVGQWLETWSSEYLGHVKPATAELYRDKVRLHIAPHMGAVRLSELHPHIIQAWINGLDVSPSYAGLIFKVLHAALEKAVELNYIQKNPTIGCVLQKAERKEMRPFSDTEMSAFMKAAQGDRLEHLFLVAFLTGARLSELLGLTWGVIDKEAGTITIDKQLARPQHRNGSIFTSPKSGKPRVISPAASVFVALDRQRIRQMEYQLASGELWDNENNLVFSNSIGAPVERWTVEAAFKRILKAAGLNGFRFHDTRHTYAVNALRAGDDPKTVQEALGHASAAFTLNVYGHVTEDMRQASAIRMEKFIQGAINL